jgi:hypothetical protein
MISKNQRIGGGICAAAAEQVVLSTGEQTRELWSIESRADAASATQSYQLLKAWRTEVYGRLVGRTRHEVPPSEAGTLPCPATRLAVKYFEGLRL